MFYVYLLECQEADAVVREKFLKGGSGRTYLKKQLKYYLEEKI